jgi:CHAD domain-containing protein
LRRTAEEDSEESLHDLRIALRCLRRLLGAFARPLRDTSGPPVSSASCAT